MDGSDTVRCSYWERLASTIHVLGSEPYSWYFPSRPRDMERSGRMVLYGEFAMSRFMPES
jgi:hypothetical protein